jgi:hypothetical protein
MRFATFTFISVGSLGVHGMLISTTSRLELFVASSLLVAISVVLGGLCYE